MDGDLTGRVVIIGGGISGLAAAYRLAREAPAVHVTLVEAEERLGGKIATEQVAGFIIEAGPDSFLSSKPRGVGLCEELGLGDRLQGVTPWKRRAFILFDGAMHDIPEGLTGLVPTRLAPLARSGLLSWRGKLRVALDYLIPARRDNSDEALGAFIRRRLGNEAWERLVEPLMAGIYAADGDTLSLAATFPQLRQAERDHGGLIRGVLAARKVAPLPAPPARSAFLTPRGGLGEIVSALEQAPRAAGATILLGTAAESIEPAEIGFRVRLNNGQALGADAVIVATPSYAAASILSEMDASLAAELDAIPHSSTAIVSLAYRSDEIPASLEGHGYVIPRTEGGPVLACTWSSRKWAGRAPEGWELLRVFIGRSGHLQEELELMSDDDLIDLARREIETRLGATARQSLARVQRWPLGMPQYVLGHPERVSRIEATASARPGLYLAGNAYRGVGIPDCIASGERAASVAIAYLSGRATSPDATELANASVQSSVR